jgi:multidrug efflux pump subunit AcrA (membrane-fusion protein)
VLVVPYAAVLESSEGPYVLVASTDGRTLTQRRVEIGRVLGGLAVVLSGLHVQERVLVRSAFFVDAERRLYRQAAVELTP